MDNQELRRRYEHGDPLADLAADAEMSVAGLQARLRRIGVPPQRRASTAHDLDPNAVAMALRTHRSVAAAARALGASRRAVTAVALRHGLIDPPAVPDDLAGRHDAGASLDELARHYHVGVDTIRRWMAAAGITPRPAGRRPRDG